MNFFFTQNLNLKKIYFFYYVSKIERGAGKVRVSDFFFTLRGGGGGGGGGLEYLIFFFTKIQI